MTTNEEQIRTLIERWAEAVHRGDLDTVLADHAEDIVMFDVPPPYEGVRGIDAYRESWPPFFQFQARGGSFDIESLEVVAGEDVAFAYALLRCGTAEEFATDPDNRLRLTLGLGKRDGRWVVTHEHHSFPLVQTDAGARDDNAGRDDDAGQELRRLHERWFDATETKDLDGMMAAIAGDVVSYEHEQPLRYRGVQAVREVCRRGLDEAAAVRWTVPDLEVLVRDDLAVAWGLNHMQASQPGGATVDSWSRGTRVFARRDGAWQMIHQHVSFPFDPDTGKARTDLHP